MTHHSITADEADRSAGSEWTRRRFLSWSSAGLGSVALAALLGNDSRTASAAGVPGEASDPPPHFPARVKRVIHIFAFGGVSQVDSFDYKPKLIQLHGKSLQSSERPDVFFGKVGLLRKPDWEFRQRGQSGLWISDLFPQLGSVADDLTIINSMVAETSNHTPGAFQANTGFRLNGFPTLGAWLSYGLGTESDDLPAYVVIPDVRGYPAGGAIHWSNGFLPARHQGVVVRSQGAPMSDLTPAQPIATNVDQASRELLAAINLEHRQQHPQDDPLSARIRAYELAARMQLTVPDVAALESETAATQAAYGLDQPPTKEFGRSCLLARRLLERGVRFVQILSGGAFGSPRINWDAHESVVKNHGQEALRVDQPLAALIRDLKQRGLFEDTLLVFSTEFGRTPFTQSNDNEIGEGRDHNQAGFTCWMAGGGLKSGVRYGATDDVGYRSVENPVSWYDFHATILRLLGIDHERLTYYHNGIRRRLTNVHGRPLMEILA